MNYKIVSIESKTTSTGKAMKKAVLVDESGAEYKDVAIWSSFPDFANLVEGSTIVAEMETKQNGQYTNISLKSPVASTTGGYTRSSGAISKAQDKKAEYIEKAQDNKNEAIKIASTFTSAVNCAIAEYNKDPHNLDTLEQLISKWRRVLWFEFDNHHNEFPPFVK